MAHGPSRSSSKLKDRGRRPLSLRLVRRLTDSHSLHGVSSKELPTLAVKSYVIYPLLAWFLLTGCSQANPGTSTPEIPTPTTTASVAAPATATPAKATLLDTCPQVESVVITTNGFPAPEEWVAARAKMQIISNAGDLEAQNALTGLLASFDKLESGPTGMELLDARKAYRDALSGLAGRCRTVGSSALQ